MEGFTRMLWTACLTFVISTTIIDCHPVETKTHDELKKEIKGIKTEIQELFDRINDLSSSKTDDDDSDEVNVYHDSDDVSKICLTKDCIGASHRLFKQMDLTADPCQDFNQFSCGNFIKNQLIPDDKTSYNAFSHPRDVGKLLFIDSQKTKNQFIVL